MIRDRTWRNDIDYQHPQSLDPLDALKLALLFHAGGPWDDQRAAEWLRITGTREATSRVLCDTIRRTLATLGWQS
jgi:hypothetical protein